MGNGSALAMHLPCPEQLAGQGGTYWVVTVQSRVAPAYSSHAVGSTQLPKLRASTVPVGSDVHQPQERLAALEACKHEVQSVALIIAQVLGTGGITIVSGAKVLYSGTEPETVTVSGLGLGFGVLSGAEGVSGFWPTQGVQYG